MTQLNLAPTDDQRMLNEALERLLRVESVPARVHAAPSGHDPKLWASLVEMGIPLLRVPEERGGLGLSLYDHVLVAETAGQFLAPAPVVEVITAASVLGRIDSAQAQDLLEQAAEGAIAVIALDRAMPGKPLVIPGAAVADMIIAPFEDGLYAFRDWKVDAPAATMMMAPLASVSLDPDDGILLGSGDAVMSSWAAAKEEWKLATASTLVGTSGDALRLAADYSNERTQFGRKIGSFQGVAHPLADSQTDIDGARLLIVQAVSAIATGKPDAGALCAMAFWWSTQVAGPATERAVRTFGGYGVSLEQDIQLHYRRAKALSLVAGDPERELLLAGNRLWGGAQTSLPDAGDVGILFDWGERAETETERLRRFIEDNMDDELRAKIHHSTKGHSKPFASKLAAEQLLYLDLPKDMGGAGLTKIEAAAADAVWEDLDWNRTASGVTEFLMKLANIWGTPEAKAEIVPAMNSGAAVGCLGLTEPQSGTDVFGCQFRAERGSDGWILSGQKMFTTGGHIADYIFMLTRTDSSGAKHQGLTCFIVPMNLPGIEIHAVQTLQDERTNITYFNDVVVPDIYRLGEADHGVRVMQSMLELEHSGITYHYSLPPMLRHAVAWASEGEAGERPIDDPQVRRRLARAAVTVAVSEGLSRRDVWSQAVGQSSQAYGPMAKLFSTEGLRSAASDLVAMAAPQSLLARSDDMSFVETAMRRAIAMTIYGGSSEIQRSIVAEQILGMPKSRT